MKYFLGVSLVVGLTAGWPMENQYRGDFMAPVDFDFSRPGKSWSPSSPPLSSTELRFILGALLVGLFKFSCTIHCRQSY